MVVAQECRACNRGANEIWVRIGGEHPNRYELAGSLELMLKATFGHVTTFRHAFLFFTWEKKKKALLTRCSITSSTVALEPNRGGQERRVCNGRERSVIGRVKAKAKSITVTLMMSILCCRAMTKLKTKLKARWFPFLVMLLPVHSGKLRYKPPFPFPLFDAPRALEGPVRVLNSFSSSPVFRVDGTPPPIFCAPRLTSRHTCVFVVSTIGGESVEKLGANVEMFVVWRCHCAAMLL